MERQGLMPVPIDSDEAREEQSRANAWCNEEIGKTWGPKPRNSDFDKAVNKCVFDSLSRER